LKILYIKGFDQNERETFRSVIYGNVISAIKALAGATIEYQLPVSNKALVDAVMSWPDDSTAFSSDNLVTIQKLWAEPGIQEAYQQRNKFPFVETGAYFLNMLDKLIDKSYTPNDQDILHARLKTTGIHEIEFTVENTPFKLVDVGGQRSERRKWIHCFEEVTAILFITAASEFDQKLVEDTSVNRMHESLKLFKEISNSKWFMDTSIILFFNKKDLFEEKIKKKDLSEVFPEYKGGNNYDKACEFLTQKFVSQNENAKKSIYVHFTCATDTENVKVVWNATRDIILRKLLDRAGLGGSEL